MKLDYKEVGECSTDVQAFWDRKLSTPGRNKVPLDKKEVHNAVGQGEGYPEGGGAWIMVFTLM